MQPWSVLQVVRMVSPEGIPRPYRIIETHMTSEGPRTRVCSGAFKTFDEAERARQDIDKPKKDAA